MNHPAILPLDPQTQSQATDPHAYRMILDAASIGALMLSLDATMVTLALPSIMNDLHANMWQMICVVGANVLAAKIMPITLRRLTNTLGRVRMYHAGTTLFILGSALCGMATTPLDLIIFRLVQCSGLALALLNGFTLIMEAIPTFHPNRTRGLFTLTWAMVGIVGLVLAGLFLSLANWRWLFFLNVPLGSAAVIWGYLTLKESPVHTLNQKFDPRGVVRFNWELVKFRAYRFSALAAMLQAAATFSVPFLLIIYLLTIRGYDPLSAALTIIPLPFLSVVAAPLANWMSRHGEARIPAAAGLILQASGLVWMAQLTPESFYIYIIFGLGLMGVGVALFFSPNLGAAMAAVPSHLRSGAAASLTTFRLIGMLASFILAMAVVSSSLHRPITAALFASHVTTMSPILAEAFTEGMHKLFYVSMGLCLLAAGLTFVKDRTKII
jgi:MFS family permease